MPLYQNPIVLSEKGMRILRFPLVRLIIALSILFVGASIAALLTSQFSFLTSVENFESWIKPLLSMIFHSGMAILGYWLFVSLFDGRPMTELNSGFFRYSGSGILLGFLFISLIIAIMALAGFYRISGWNPDHRLLTVFSMAVTAGVLEEIFLRGYFFRIVEEGLGTWWSTVLSALLFGFLHAGNPNATFVSSLSIALTAGVVLALLFAITRNLWIVIGMHFAWNFTLGGIYSAPVSGTEAIGIVQSTISGPVWLTGGEFGPEASVITIIVFAFFGLYLIRKTIKDNMVIKPLWKRKEK